MKCRQGCGACCIAPSISTPIPGMPKGKPAGIRCTQLTEDNKCKIFGMKYRPKVCVDIKASVEMCGYTYKQAHNYLQKLEEATKPSI